MTPGGPPFACPAAEGAHPLPLPPGRLARRRVVGTDRTGQLLSMPVCFFPSSSSSFILSLIRRSGTVGNIISEAVADTPSRRKPLCYRFRARPEVGDERRRNQNTLSSCAPLRRRHRARPRPKSAMRGVGSKFHVQLRAHPPPPQGQARSRRREA